MSAHAQQVTDLGYQIHPEKILENTEGVIEIFVSSEGYMIPKNISNLKVTSSDSSIIEILGVDESQEYSTKIKIKALAPGKANLAVAASGFSSQEIPLNVYSSNNDPTKLLIKATPNDFAVDGPKFGYVSVELANSGGLPTTALQDTIIKLDSPDTSVVELTQNEITIKKGEYYGVAEFEVKNSGDAIIFAQTENMKKVSEKIHIREADLPLTLKMYVFPQKFLSMTNNIGYAIVQLEDNEGVPIKSTEDIKIKVAVENPGATVNSSHDYEEIIFDSKELIIKEGEYSTFTKFSPRPDFSDLIRDRDLQGLSSSEYAAEKSFNIGISAEDYKVTSSSVTVVHDDSVGELNGKGPVNVGIIPFLTTGDTEILGVAYLETDVEISKRAKDGSRFTAIITLPVMADESFVMNADSSSLKTVNIEDPVFNKGFNAAIIYGKTGTVQADSKDQEIPLDFTFEDNEGIKKVTALAEGPVIKDLQLRTESLIPEILVGHEFPILSYIWEEEEGDTVAVDADEEEAENGRAGPTHFIKDTVITFSADDIFEIEPTIVKQNDPYALISGHAKQIGSSSISGSGGEFETGLFLDSKTTDPTKIHLSYVKTVFPKTTSLATIQLLDSANNPVYASKDIVIKLVSDNDKITIPNSVTVKKDQYFTTFSIISNEIGEFNISTLSENFPLNKFQINVAAIEPNLILNLPDSVNPNETFEGELSLTFKESGLSLLDHNVNWIVEGGKIIDMDQTTNQNGIATLTAKATDPQKMRITAEISSQGFFESSISKPMSIIQPQAPITEVSMEQNSEPSFLINEKYALFMIIPVAIGIAIFLLKKTNRLDEIMERVNVGEKIEDVKERISNLKDR